MPGEQLHVPAERREDCSYRKESLVTDLRVDNLRLNLGMVCNPQDGMVMLRNLSFHNNLNPN